MMTQAAIPLLLYVVVGILSKWDKPVINLVFPSISLPAAGSRRGEATPSKMLFQLVSV